MKYFSWLASALVLINVIVMSTIPDAVLVVNSADSPPDIVNTFSGTGDTATPVNAAVYPGVTPASLWICNYTAGTVSVIRSDNGNHIATISGFVNPYTIAISDTYAFVIDADNQTLYPIQLSSPYTVYAGISLTGGANVGSVVAYNSKVYAVSSSLAGIGYIDVFDHTTLNKITTIELQISDSFVTVLGGMTIGHVSGSDYMGFVPVFGGAGTNHGSQTLFAFNPDTYAVLNYISIPIHVVGIVGGAVGNAAVYGGHVYCTNFIENVVNVFPFTTSGLTGTFSSISGFDNPFGIATVGSDVYVANFSDHNNPGGYGNGTTLNIIDTSSNAITGTISGFDSPRSLTYHFDRVYVCDGPSTQNPWGTFVSGGGSIRFFQPGCFKKNQGMFSPSRGAL